MAKPVGLDYDTSFSRKPLAVLLRRLAYRLVIWLPVKALAPTEVLGIQRLDKVDLPVIVVANHQSHADTSVLLAALPARLRRRMVVAAAVDNFFTTHLRSFLSALLVGCIPIERFKVNRRSAELPVQLLGEGWGLLIFPEGGRSHDGSITEFKPGAAYISVKSGAPVQIAYLDGPRFVAPKGVPGVQKAGLHRHRCRVVFGPLLHPEDHGNDTRGFAAAIEGAVRNLEAPIR